MTDSAKQIKTKINKYAFSGGRETVEEHRQFGGNPDVDVAYSYLTYLLEDDNELESIRTRYKSGELLTGELKALCIKEVQDYVKEFQERRAQVTDAVLDMFMEKRPLEWGGKMQGALAAVSDKAAAGAEGPAADGETPKEITKNQLKKLDKLKKAQEKKDQKAQAKTEPSAPAEEAA